MNKRAAKLLELLDGHVASQWLHEQHLKQAVNNGFSNMTEEHESYDEVTRLQEGVMFDCEVAGFRYAVLNEIIPPPFSTTHMDRLGILADLKQYAEKNHV